jgi:hypothetical protein
MRDLIFRVGIAAALAVSGFGHAYLYVHGYRVIPHVGDAFLVQSSACFAVAVLLIVGGPTWLRWAAALLAAGSLVAFAMSRTIGIFGFTERGWQPSPHAAVSLAAELLTVVLCAVWASHAVRSTRTTAMSSLIPPSG